MNNIPLSSVWRCDICNTTYASESEAKRCENRHQQARNRQAAYREALADNRMLIARLSPQSAEQVAISGIFLVIKPTESRQTTFRFQTIEDEVRYTMTDASHSFNDFLPVSCKYSRYVTIKEAIAAGWCPFFLQHFQTWPLTLREQIVETFLSLPEEVQHQHLLARNAMTKAFCEE